MKLEEQLAAFRTRVVINFPGVGNPQNMISLASEIRSLLDLDLIDVQYGATSFIRVTKNYAYCDFWQVSGKPRRWELKTITTEEWVEIT